MSDESATQDQTTTFTQEEVDALVEERNKALEQKTQELLAETKTAKELARTHGDELAQLQAKLADLEQEREAKKAGITSEQLDKMRQEAEANLEKKYGPLKDQLEAHQAEIRTLRLDNVVQAAMSKNGVRGERVDALYRLTADRFDLTDDGKPMLKDDPGTPIDTYISDTLGKEWPELFEGTGSSGGGAPRSVASGSGKVRKVTLSDTAGFMENLEAIAKGDVEVTE
jgi:hypothetical protein